MSACNLYELSISDALPKLRARCFSCREFADALISRSDACAGLNALTSFDWDALRRDADAADINGIAGRDLGGIPLVFKANINTERLTTCAGTGSLKSRVAGNNATVAQSLFSAGALLGAKANMHELAFGITCNNAVTGAVRNPFDLEMIPGGSSGGVAAAVAAGMMPGGIGTDTGASVRLPAALCGIAGFRPTVGRYSSSGIVPISRTRDTAGPMARGVMDIRLLDSALCPKADTVETTGLERIRIGVPRTMFYENLDPELAGIIGHALDTLADSGIELLEVEIPDIGALNDAVSFPVALYEFMRDLPRHLNASGCTFSPTEILAGIGSPDVRDIFRSQLGEEAMPEEAYLAALNIERPKLQKAYERYFRANSLDAALIPTTPLPARPIGDDELVELNGDRVPTFSTYIRNTDPGSNAGIPGISLPAGFTSSGLPVGLELDGPAGSDDRLLRIAQAVETAMGICGLQRPGTVFGDTPQPNAANGGNFKQGRI